MRGRHLKSLRHGYLSLHASDDHGIHITIDGRLGDSLFDEPSFSARDLRERLDTHGHIAEISVDLNSPGGSIADALVIWQVLSSHYAKVDVNVLGQASGAAAIIVAAADTVTMGLGAFMYMCRLRSLFYGNSMDAEDLCKDLDLLDAHVLNLLVARVGERRRAELSDARIGDDGNGTILSAAECVRLGLADAVSSVRAVASVADLVECHSDANLSDVRSAQMAIAQTMAAVRIQQAQFGGTQACYRRRTAHAMRARYRRGR